MRRIGVDGFKVAEHVAFHTFKGEENALSARSDRFDDELHAHQRFALTRPGAEKQNSARREPREQWSINPDGKRSLCDWVRENGGAKDFENFDRVFEILKKCLN